MTPEEQALKTRSPEAHRTAKKPLTRLAEQHLLCIVGKGTAQTALLTLNSQHCVLTQEAAYSVEHVFSSVFFDTALITAAVNVRVYAYTVLHTCCLTAHRNYKLNFSEASNNKRADQLQ